jgi:type IV pilus assembly protein PilV
VQSRLVDGFTFIEVLVAVLLLAIGILGAAGAQVAALRSGHVTGLMSGGVQLAASLAERMRANSGANAYQQLQYDAAGGPPAPAAVACFGAASCNSAQLAQFDLYEVKQALFSGFPEGRVAVCRDTRVGAGAKGALAWDCAAAPNAPLVIKLGWRDRRIDGDAPIKPSLAMIVGGAFP